jgi:hypothetical protein
VIGTRQDIRFVTEKPPIYFLTIPLTLFGFQQCLSWLISEHPSLQALKQNLDQGKALPVPDALLINGLSKGASFTGEKGNHHIIEYLFNFFLRCY